MRLKHTNLVLGLCLVTWALVLYFAFLNHTANTITEKTSNAFKLSKLEQGISQQFKINNDMIHDAGKYLEHKKQLVEKGIQNGPKNNLQDFKLPILVFACNRVSVNKCLDKLIEYRPDPDKFPIIVSQVCIYF